VGSNRRRRQIRKRQRQRPPTNRAARHTRRFDVGERPQHVAFHRRNRYAVPIDDPVARNRADAIARRDDAGEIQRIGGADGNEAIGRGRSPDLAERVDGVRQRELFAGHP
jgi:hypothetical protein